MSPKVVGAPARVPVSALGRDGLPRTRKLRAHCRSLGLESSEGLPPLRNKAGFGVQLTRAEVGLSCKLFRLFCLDTTLALLQRPIFDLKALAFGCERGHSFHETGFAFIDGELAFAEPGRSIIEPLCARLAEGERFAHLGCDRDEVAWSACKRRVHGRLQVIRCCSCVSAGMQVWDRGDRGFLRCGYCGQGGRCCPDVGRRRHHRRW